AYANAGQPKEALKAYMRMLASRVCPNAYTYAVLIKGLVGDVFEGLVREEKVDEAVKLLEEMKGKGFVPDEKAVREVLSNKRGHVFRTVISILFGK
ncbi:pentatricopeptide repeat-containing protein, partial [Trifolium medium]|nr:pentatricopeptide repeat-containing protein [Trifolium medium]